jgi:endonuclease/exonuclease/phosphatase family metal-dependent hydrolase
MLFLAAVLLVGGCRGTTPVTDGAEVIPPARIVIASWNVENLFDTEDDPANEGDDEFTPRGWVRWSNARYALKLEHLAEIIARMKPDVLCLAEIENRRVLEDLRQTLLEKQAYDLPVVLHREGPDPRGIDVAMLSRHVAVATNWLPNATRETLACDFEIGGRRLMVLANHWKSQTGKKAENDELRRKDALAVRHFLDGRLAADPAAAVVVAGDFNDQVTSPIMNDTAGFVLDKRQVLSDGRGMLLFNLSGGLPPDGRGTYWYNAGKVWNSFDCINVTRGMLPGAEPPAPWRVCEETYRIFKTPAQLDEDGHPVPFRFVRSKEKGNAFKTGYSDHFPVLVELEPH